jgi:hypothetical protein
VCSLFEEVKMQRKVGNLLPQLSLALVCLLWLGVAAMLHYSPRTSKASASASWRMHPGGAEFAIADLDGDRIPDLAFVELGSQRSAQANYSIRLQLSAGSESAVGVDAPIGGLQVAARDVNGDEYVDLVVTSNLDASFVEVLLNDGHGNFSVAAPGTYKKLQDETYARVNGAGRPGANQSSLEPPRSSFGQEGVTRFGYLTAFSSDSFPLLEDGVASRKAPHSRFGRSPPFPLAAS